MLQRKKFLSPRCPRLVHAEVLPHQKNWIAFAIDRLCGTLAQKSKPRRTGARL